MNLQSVLQVDRVFLSTSDTQSLCVLHNNGGRIRAGCANARLWLQCEVGKQGLTSWWRERDKLD